MSTGKFGLTLRKKEEQQPAEQKPKAAVFNQDSDDEQEDQSAAAKFQRKYASQEKNKDKKMMEKLIAEDPSIFDYDGQYERDQKIKEQKIAAQREADKEKKPKYAHKIMDAHKKRELEKLLHDEHTYKKERAEEAGEFDDKEVFITGAYRQQIEERNQFRKELEIQDKLDEMRDVKNQSLWQHAFQRKMLEDRARVYDLPLPVEEGEESSIKKELADVKQEPASIEPTETEMKPNKEELAKTMVKEEEKQRESEEPQRKRRREEDGEEARPSRREESRRSSQSGTSKPHQPPVDPLMDDLTEDVRRMEVIRKILSRRNDRKAIEEARQRYLERRERNEIIPPFV